MSFAVTSNKLTGSSPDSIKSDAQELLDRLHYEVATAAEMISDIMSISNNIAPIINAPCDPEIAESPRFDEKESGILPSLSREILLIHEINKSNRIVLNHLKKTILI